MEHLPQIGWQLSVQKTCLHRLQCSEQHGALARSGWSRPPEILIIVLLIKSFIVKFVQSCSHAWCGLKVLGNGLPSSASINNLAEWSVVMLVWKCTTLEISSDKKLSWKPLGQIQSLNENQIGNCENCGQVQQRNYHESLMDKLRIRSLVSGKTVKTVGKYSREIIMRASWAS